jgi:hypothetical protein
MRAPLLTVALLVSTAPALADTNATTSFLESRRVNISLTFSGSSVFMFGTAPAGTARIVSVMEGPIGSEVRLLKKGRVALFWLGVRQYRLGGLPSLYLVNGNCPQCNRVSDCPHGGEDESWNAVLGPLGGPIGREALRARARIECLSGPLEPGEAHEVVDGFWDLQARRGLYAVAGNRVRLGASNAYFHTFPLSSHAPDGRYRITTYFLSPTGTLDMRENELFVRKSGLVASLARLSERRPAVYGIVTVLIAIAAGWVAGAMFRRGGGH